MITYTQDQLPLASAGIPGTGGVVKQSPEDFIVEEIPLYTPSGEGEHLYLTLRRRDRTTRTLQKQLADLFKLQLEEVGYAGLKDRVAVATQTFSLHGVKPHQAEIVAEALDVELLGCELHTNKLQPGHLRGNHFEILVRLPFRETADQHKIESRANRILDMIRRRGMLNYFGPQRFGLEQDNHQLGRRLVRGERMQIDRWKRNLYVSAYQSYLFNFYLMQRWQAGWIDDLLTGDVARKLATGGLFHVRDAAVERPRFQAGEIAYTGPIYGYKLMTAEENAGELEQAILVQEDLSLDDFRRVRAVGDRRPGIVRPNGLELECTPEGIWLRFDLPPGSYASVLVREVTKLPFTRCG